MESSDIRCEVYLSPVLTRVIHGYGMGGCTVLGQDVAGDGAVVTGVSQLSGGAGPGGAGVPALWVALLLISLSVASGLIQGSLSFK